jgi:glycosyltransferase involved in cell wall biosynthesis
LLGERDNQVVNEILTISDIFVLITEFEALGLAALEAMINKLPVVLSNVGGLTELINNGEGGFLIDDKKLEEFSDKISFLIENQEIRKQFGDKNKETTQRIFSLINMVEGYKNLYSKDNLF